MFTFFFLLFSSVCACVCVSPAGTVARCRGALALTDDALVKGGGAPAFFGPRLIWLFCFFPRRRFSVPTKRLSECIALISAETHVKEGRPPVALMRWPTDVWVVQPGPTASPLSSLMTVGDTRAQETVPGGRLAARPPSTSCSPLHPLHPNALSPSVFPNSAYPTSPLPFCPPPFKHPNPHTGQELQWEHTRSGHSHPEGC